MKKIKSFGLMIMALLAVNLSFAQKMQSESKHDAPAKDNSGMCVGKAVRAEVLEQGDRRESARQQNHP